MNRFGAILVILLLSASAFAQQGGPRDLAGQSDTPEQPQAQLQRSVTQLYFVNLRNEVGLTDEQVLKSQGIIANFIGMRFRDANRKKALDRRQEQLLSQPDASEADIQKLNDDVAKLASETGTWETRMVKKLQAELGDRQLSERQILLLSSYNRKFFNERLPMILEQLRARNGPIRGQPQNGTAARPNPQNRRDQPGGPANTLRGTDTQPVQPRQKLAR
jgi:hypothetical protein